MRFDKEINQALKITLVFVVISSTFTLLEKLSEFVPIGNNNVNMDHFLKVNMLWFISVILIIIGICFYIKKADGKFNHFYIDNPIVRLTSGLLIIFDGIINLTNKVSVLHFNIQTFHQASSLIENADKIIRNALISSTIPVLIYLLQILFGLYFVLSKKTSSANSAI